MSKLALGFSGSMTTFPLNLCGLMGHHHQHPGGVRDAGAVVLPVLAGQGDTSWMPVGVYS